MDPELRILVTNVFGLTSKFGKFQHLIHTYRPDVAIVTETKFTIDKMSLAESSIPGYGEPLRLDHTDQGGGIAVWCKSSLAVAPLDILPNLCSDVRWCTLRLQIGFKAGDLRCVSPRLMFRSRYHYLLSIKYHYRSLL